jgi:hypothetical protein
MELLMRYLFLGLLFASACFNPDEPVCAFVCGTGGKCPDNYECRADNYCHRKGTTEACPGYSDASVPDIGMPDLSMLDLSMPDMSVMPPQDGAVDGAMEADMTPDDM